MADAEKVHHAAMKALKISSAYDGFAGGYIKDSRCLWNINFLNPMGLAAGFDKNGECLLAWQRLGFGYVEVGTVTAVAQEGNPKPRLFRLPEELALINRLGFNNQGARQVAQNITLQRKHSSLKIPIGINIGKSKVTPLEKAAADYLISFNLLADLADYVVINVSSPNTPGLRDLQATKALSELLEVICNANQKRKIKKPILLKLAPDLSVEDANACAKVATQFNLSGLVISNTTISRDGIKSAEQFGAGGLSGKPLFTQSTNMLKILHAEHKTKLKFIGVGGITDKSTAKIKLNSGADLLQAYTGFIYGGPGFVRNILKK